MVSYSAAFLGYSRLQLKEIDRRTGKFLTVHNGFYPKSNVERLFLSRSEGSRRLIGVQDTVETAILVLRNYVRNSEEKLLIAARTIEDSENRETPYKYKKKKMNERKTQWTQKKLHGQYIRQTTVKPSVDRWGWLRKGYLKRTTEALVMVEQEQAIRTNNMKEKIDKA